MLLILRGFFKAKCDPTYNLEFWQIKKKSNSLFYCDNTQKLILTKPEKPNSEEKKKKNFTKLKTQIETKLTKIKLWQN